MKEILILGFLVTGFVGINMYISALRGGRLRRQGEQRADTHNR